MKHLYWVREKVLHHSCECWCKGDRVFNVGMLASEKLYLWLEEA